MDRSGDLREYLADAKERGELIEPGGPLSLRHEITAFLDVVQERRKAAVFIPRASGGPDVAVAGNLFYSKSALAQAMGVEEGGFIDAFRERQTRPVDPVKVEAFPASGITSEKVDLPGTLPILTHYREDSGPFITTGLASAVDPETGVTARGIHRMELRGVDSLGIALINPPLGTLLAKAKAAGKKLPLAVAVGIDPITFIGAALKASPGTDKLAVAGGLKGRAVEVADAPLTGIPVPANAEFILEGEVDPDDMRPDGPLGEISGYSLAFQGTPTFRVKRIHHRANPIYHALSPASREADLILTIVAEATMDPGLRKAFPAIVDFVFVPGTFGSSMAVRMERTGRAEVRSLLARLLSLPMIKKVVAVGPDVDPENPCQVEWSIATRCRPAEDVIILSDLRGQPIDPSTGPGYATSKIAFDATGFSLPSGAVRVGHDPAAMARALQVFDRS